ncbi:MAG: hypothetical protein PHG05_02655 [Candidatus Nanoarchaeia archaeon]|nr:hypothetical protein [Candidatus Nanoarchaeia archaeon]
MKNQRSLNAFPAEYWDYMRRVVIYIKEDKLLDLDCAIAKAEDIFKATNPLQNILRVSDMVKIREILQQIVKHSHLIFLITMYLLADDYQKGILAKNVKLSPKCDWEFEIELIIENLNKCITESKMDDTLILPSKLKLRKNPFKKWWQLWK